MKNSEYSKSQYLEIGKITSVFGVKGEVKVMPWCDSPEFLTEFELLHWKSGTDVAVEHSRVHKGMVIMKLKGVDSVDEAQRLRNHVLYIDRKDVELDEDCVFIADMLGMQVFDSKTDELYGKIVDFTETGANDIYHVKAPDGRLLLVPAIEDVIDEVDTDKGVMTITPLDGLFDI